MSTNFLNYQVALIPANAELIDKLNTLLVPGYDGSDSTETTTKPSGKTITMSAVKKAMTAGKAEHGLDHIRACAEELGVDADGLTMGKIASAVDPEDYEAFLNAIDTAPEDDDDDDFDDDDDDGLDDDDIDADAVKAAVKQYAKDNDKAAAKDIMKKCKIKVLSEVDDMSEAGLAKLHKLATS